MMNARNNIGDFFYRILVCQLFVKTAALKVQPWKESVEENKLHHLNANYSIYIRVFPFKILAIQHRTIVHEGNKQTHTHIHR